MKLDWLLYLLAAGAVFLLLRPSKKKETAQDLLELKEVYPDGLIELPGGKFRLVVEIEPVNLALRSFQEQAAVWAGLRGMVNSLSVPCTFLVQARHLDLRDYLDDYRRRAEDCPPHIRDYALSLADWLAKEAEGKHLRDRRFYAVLKMDAASAGVEGGVQTDNPVVNEATRLLSGIGKSKLPPDELRRLARDSLFEAAAVIIGSLGGLEIGARVLDRREALEMLYATFNRDLAPFASFADADRDGAFSLFPASATPGIILKESGVADIAQA
jgi:hypothetical protein